ncbi:MAG TPA: hypothetical protein DIV86_04350 [Alphaproteobacteria bacterium]|nr:hypothetical protein [Alphaproteobacteria bacterium]
MDQRELEKVNEKLKDLVDSAYKVGDEISRMILLINGESEGRPIWAYVSMSPSKAKEYLIKQYSEEEIELSDYGEILFSGEGETPPHEIKNEMLEKHKIQENLEEKLYEVMKDNLFDRIR